MKTTHILRAAVGVALFLTSLPAMAYGPEGHRIVGAIAEKRLEGTNTLVRVRQILGNMSLAEASIWADSIKSGPIPGDADSAAYLAANRNHKPYHYVNLPFQARYYSLTTPGARADDVVQISKQCIQFLQGQPGANPHRLNQRTALLLLAHFTGDMHQPLHVGCGYIDAPTHSFVNPAFNATAKHDHGGNNIDYRSGLHTFFDSTAVGAARRHAVTSGGWLAYANLLAARTPAAGWANSGAPANWPKQWANNALPLADSVYRQITLTTPGTKAGHWNVTVTPTFETSARELTDKQLAKAGYRLAAVLKAILP